MFSWLLFLWLLTAYRSFYKITLSSLVDEQDPGAYWSLIYDITLPSHLWFWRSYSPIQTLNSHVGYLVFENIWDIFFFPFSKVKFKAIRYLNCFLQWEMLFSYLIKLRIWLLRYTFFIWGPQLNFLPCLVPKLCLFTSASDPWNQKLTDNTRAVLGFNVALVIHVFSVVLPSNHDLYFHDVCTVHLTA